VFLWFAAGAAAIVWFVFQSPAVDLRTVMLGAVVPLIETPFGDGPLHTLAVACVVLTLTMGLTVGRRLRRRRWLGVPIGLFLHLVLDGTWSRSSVFWWPLGSGAFPARPALVVERGLWSVVLELLGLAIAVGLWRRLGLEDAGRRRRFLREGRVERDRLHSSGTC
jgi:hypothetical protein